MLSRCEQYNNSLKNTKAYDLEIKALIDYSHSPAYQRKLRMIRNDLSERNNSSTDESQDSQLYVGL